MYRSALSHQEPDRRSSKFHPSRHLSEIENDAGARDRVPASRCGLLFEGVELRGESEARCGPKIADSRFSKDTKTPMGHVLRSEHASNGVTTIGEALAGRRRRRFDCRVDTARSRISVFVSWRHVRAHVLPHSK